MPSYCLNEKPSCYICAKLGQCKTAYTKVITEDACPLFTLASNPLVESRNSIINLLGIDGYTVLLSTKPKLEKEKHMQPVKRKLDGNEDRNELLTILMQLGCKPSKFATIEELSLLTKDELATYWAAIDKADKKAGSMAEQASENSEVPYTLPEAQIEGDLNEAYAAPAKTPVTGTKPRAGRVKKNPPPVPQDRPPEQDAYQAPSYTIPQTPVELNKPQLPINNGQSATKLSAGVSTAPKSEIQQWLAAVNNQLGKLSDTIKENNKAHLDIEKITELFKAAPLEQKLDLLLSGVLVLLIHNGLISRQSGESKVQALRELATFFEETPPENQ